MGSPVQVGEGEQDKSLEISYSSEFQGFFNIIYISSKIDVLRVSNLACFTDVLQEKQVPCYKSPSMAITYKLFVERTPRGNKKFALKLRITYNRKHKVIPMNIELLKEDWNAATQKVKPSHPNAKLITLKINQTINEVRKRH